ncbi:MAG: DUF378 domain-containing protein [Alphaproteobacteria bacterium]|nr:DUF378 domain-containing protein [Alphaproteobacteria bacterium]
MKYITLLAFILLIVGGLNWGLVGFFGFDLVAALFGMMSPLSRVVYDLVGLSAIWVAFDLLKDQTKPMNR